MMAPFYYLDPEFDIKFTPEGPQSIMDLEHPPDILYKDKLISFHTEEWALQW